MKLKNEVIKLKKRVKKNTKSRITIRIIDSRRFIEQYKTIKNLYLKID